jgi:hypothetical protein
MFIAIDEKTTRPYRYLKWSISLLTIICQFAVHLMQIFNVEKQHGF